MPHRAARPGAAFSFSGLRMRRMSSVRLSRPLATAVAVSTDARGRPPGRLAPRSWRQALALVVAALLSAPAQAALWGYIDGQGTAHFADHAVDSRYQLVFDDDGVAAPVRVPGKTDDAGSLLTRIEFAPEVRALRPWIREASARYGVDASLLLALMAVESGFNAAAVSPAGAIGLMQIMPVSGERYARPEERHRPVEQRLRDPRTNILTGARMLKDLLARFGRVELALAAWNAGEGAVRRAGRTIPAYAETRAHVHFVLELYWVLLQQDQARRATGLRLAAAR